VESCDTSERLRADIDVSDVLTMTEREAGSAALVRPEGSALGVRPEGSALGVRPEGSALGVHRAPFIFAKILSAARSGALQSRSRMLLTRNDR